MDTFRQFFVEFQDHLAPRLDVYEQAIYLYIARQTIAIGKREETIGFKSARKKMVIYEKLRSLELKGCIKVRSSERLGTRLEIVPPAEIPGVVPPALPEATASLDDVDFFVAAQNRRLILDREGWRCFYCLSKLDENNNVIEHVISRPSGDNGYRNVVAACRQCNNRKSSASAEGFLRTLYRDGVLSVDDFKTRLSHLERLRLGELRPQWP